MSEPIEKDATIARLRTNILRGMRDYMQEGDVSYEERHVRLCDEILGEHIRAVQMCADAGAGLELVRKTVLSLNKLNDECNSELIETDQREDICALIIRAGALRGFNGAGEDVTEEWREW